MLNLVILLLFGMVGGFSESKDGVVTFPDISTTILEKICQYFYWSLQYSRFHYLTRFSPLALHWSLEHGIVVVSVSFLQNRIAVCNYPSFTLVDQSIRMNAYASFGDIVTLQLFTSLHCPAFSLISLSLWTNVLKVLLFSRIGFFFYRSSTPIFLSFYSCIVFNYCYAYVPSFDRGKETEFHIEPELTLELMMAANYLHTWRMKRITLLNLIRLVWIKRINLHWVQEELLN